ncbi:MAG: YbjN domain-containing protein [Planctomycetes bacterium]|nr:YbjN domain-containing protein [Planctomycetota bacterium]
MNLAALTALLDRCDVSHGESTLDHVPMLLRAGGEDLLVVASISFEGKMVQFRTVGLLLAPDQEYRRELLSALMEMNDDFKLIKLAYDTDDGEVVAYVDVLLAEGEMTEAQLRRCIGILREIGGMAKTRLAEIAKSGKDPGKAASTLTRLMAHLKDEVGPAAAGGRRNDSGRKKGREGGRSFDDMLRDLLDEKGGRQVN